jgi:hypothetical protein
MSGASANRGKTGRDAGVRGAGAIEGHRLQEFTCARDHHLARIASVSSNRTIRLGKNQDDGQQSARPSSWSAGGISEYRPPLGFPTTTDSTNPCAHKPWRGTFFADKSHCWIVSYCKKLHAKGLGAELFAGGRPMPVKIKANQDFRRMPSSVIFCCRLWRWMPRRRAAALTLPSC